MQELKTLREMRGGAHRSATLVKRSTAEKRHAEERQDLRSDTSSSASNRRTTKPQTKKEITKTNRKFEDNKTDECDELRAAHSRRKKEMQNLCTHTRDEYEKHCSRDRFWNLDKFESYPTKKTSASSTVHLSATRKHARDVSKRGSGLRSSR